MFKWRKNEGFSIQYQSMKIKLEHIGYTIYIKNIEKSEHNFFACVEEVDSHSSIMWLPPKIQQKDYSLIAHEVIHVLQNICEARKMNFLIEKEHMAYLMQFILNKITGYSYSKEKL